MHRLSPAELEPLIYGALRAAPRSLKQRLLSRDPREADAAHLELTTLVISRVDNDSTMVVATDMVGPAHLARRGRWGVDEDPPAVIRPFS